MYVGSRVHSPAYSQTQPSTRSPRRFLAPRILLPGRQDLAGLLCTGVPRMAGICVPNDWKAAELHRALSLRAVSQTGKPLSGTKFLDLDQMREHGIQFPHAVAQDFGYTCSFLVL